MENILEKIFGISSKPNGDKPAFITPDGTLVWAWHGDEHRLNYKPAIIRSDGTEEWYRHGLLHRDNDEPAFVGVRGKVTEILFGIETEKSIEIMIFRP